MHETATQAAAQVPFSEVAAKRAAELDREVEQEISRLTMQIEALSNERERLTRLRNSQLAEANTPPGIRVSGSAGNSGLVYGNRLG